MFIYDRLKKQIMEIIPTIWILKELIRHASQKECIHFVITIAFLNIPLQIGHVNWDIINCLLSKENCLFS